MYEISGIIICLQHLREAERIVHTAPVYKPFVYNWYQNAYSTNRYVVSLGWHSITPDSVRQ